ncbi:MAG TPA: glucose-1-phosphate adenylyltransferase family protein [Actinomycetota bacterium]|nr:glucose-1-phosphate adenylyltransferase family protein [Actinomycetota bacterium]
MPGLMPSLKVLALVMAGGAGSRLEVLTEERAKPAMPYAGIYRLIDFPLSNCMHSRMPDVWILEQYQPHSLDDHVSNGRPWDLDRTYGGLRTMGPHQGRAESGWHHGNADAIFRNKHFIQAWDPDLVLVLSADHVYKLDYREVVERHVDQDEAVTMVTTRVTRDDVSRFGVVEVDDSGKVRGYENKPDSPSSDIATTEVFVFDSSPLIEALEEIASQRDGDDESLEDLGDDLLPNFVKEGRAREHRLDGYWRDVGTVESYWASHMELLSDDPPLRLDDPEWPIHTMSVQRPPARVQSSASVKDSLVSPGCSVSGEVVRSVLGPGAVVERGAVVRDAVLGGNVVVEERASVERAILDSETRVGRGATVGDDSASFNDVGSEDLVVTGRGAKVPVDYHVAPGERLAPASTPD